MNTTLSDNRWLFKQLEQHYNEIEQRLINFDVDHAQGIANLLKSLGYPESEIANLRRLQAEYLEALEDILPGLEMNIHETENNG